MGSPGYLDTPLNTPSYPRLVSQLELIDPVQVLTTRIGAGREVYKTRIDTASTILEI